MARDIDDRPMSIGEHLDELRRRLWLAIAGIVPIFLIGLWFGKWILNFLIAPLIEALKERHVAGASMQATQLLEGFMTYLKIAGVLSIVVGGPWIVYQLWKFVAPGLYARERRFVYVLGPLSVVFSMLGVTFMYKVMLPIVLMFFVTFNEGLLTRWPTPQVEAPPGVQFPALPALGGDPKEPKVGQIWINTEREAVRVALPNPDAKTDKERAEMPPLVLGVPLQSESFVVQHYKIGEYVSLVLTFALAFALTFQTPVVVLLLGWIGIIDVKTIGRYRKYAMLVCAIIAGVMTPPDIFSMLSLMLPMYALFEVGVILLRLLPARRVAAGLSRGETRDGAGGGGTDDPYARPDDR